MEFYIDEDSEFPTLSDGGAESHFDGAWDFDHDPQHDPVEQVSTSSFLGFSLAVDMDPQAAQIPGLCRSDPPYRIGFRPVPHMTIETWGWCPHHRNPPLTDDIASAAHRLQRELNQPFLRVPATHDRRNR